MKQNNTHEGFWLRPPPLFGCMTGQKKPSGKKLNYFCSRKKQMFEPRCIWGKSSPSDWPLRAIRKCAQYSTGSEKRLMGNCWIGMQDLPSPEKPYMQTEYVQPHAGQLYILRKVSSLWNQTCCEVRGIHLLDIVAKNIRKNATYVKF